MENVLKQSLPKRFAPHNLQVAYGKKTDEELKQAHWLFSVLGRPALATAGSLAAVWSLRLGLPVKDLIRESVFKYFCGGETAEKALKVVEELAAAQVGTVLDFAADTPETEAGFDAVRDEILHAIGLARQTKSFSRISLKPTRLGYTSIFLKLQEQRVLKAEETAAFERTVARLNAICNATAEANLTVYLDAGESWLQDPVDDLAEKIMFSYNKKRAVVFNTLQMYRTDRINYLYDCLDRFKGKETVLGIKLVRGAFLEQERERAARFGYPSPVFATKDDTDHSFNHAIDICLENLDRLELCAATHNEFSTQYLTRRIQKGEIRQHRERIHFIQHFGMSDHLTFNLASAGYDTAKYLPYGDVNMALPHLIRKVQENKSIADQTAHERSLLEKELQRRQQL
ncbi:L-proline dehydrogenase [Pontibacter ummariensis]|uniref:L-proline dehydrogenase n=1 Tax=Pontibacter ummariensis TaxID=1610492 RepID=A0A239LI77_9BACT|nr:proline dehydrogenase family protein [Pontibacter ummariensis]PRY03371.1 L-proline dehydrogenase [Pontibacter ummariensis]SNT29369.1 L-proline dehydrogenase [Pontibacter ummariensis]